MKRKNRYIASAVLAFGMLAIAAPPQPILAGNNCGSASWYALKSRTASGEMMNPNDFTAAHRSFRFGTRLKVVNQRNGRTVVVRINDRGPFAKGRVLDLSRAAAGKLGYLNQGHAPVCFSVTG